VLNGKATVFLSCSSLFKVSVAYPFSDALERIDMQGVILEDAPIIGERWEPEEKLELYLNKSDAFLALCTPDDRLDDGTVQTRPNIIDEIARARGKGHLRDRMAIFKEITVRLPSNINPTYERLEVSDLTRAIDRFLAQLLAWGFKVPTMRHDRSGHRL
jgi:hypothetical protein